MNAPAQEDSSFVSYKWEDEGSRGLSAQQLSRGAQDNHGHL